MSIIWRQFAKRHKKIEDEFIPKMDKVVSNEIQKAADYFRKNGNLSMRLDSMAMYEVLKELYKKSAFSEAAIYYNKLKNKKYLGLGQNEAWNKVVETYLLQHNVFNTVERINETTKKELLKIISDGIQRGDSIDMIVKTISENDIPLKRARLIVRTESVGAMNLGGMMGAISTGIIYQKKWVTAQDHRVRGTKKTDQFSHVVLNDTLIDMDKAFNNGENIKFPGDKTGTSAGNFCNCRCCMTYVAKRDANGRIMRYPDPSNQTSPQSGNKPGMSVGADGKLSDLMFQIIIGQILGNLIGQIFDNSAKEN